METFVTLVLVAVFILCLIRINNHWLKEEDAQYSRWNRSLPKNTNHKSLSRHVLYKNVQVKPYTETRTSDFEPPKPVRPNTTSSIKNWKR